MQSKANKIGKHLTLEERNFIEQSLNQGMSFKAIANILSKDATTISKEVKKHRIKKEGKTYSMRTNFCKLRPTCHRINMCGLHCGDRKKCSHCKICNSVCASFREERCDVSESAPYVCNACSLTHSCKSTQYTYRALSAYKEYKDTVSYSKMGINLSEEEIADLDALISPLVKQGQSIYHIYTTNSSKMPCSKQSLYRYINDNCFSIGNLDLPRKVRLRKRKKKNSSPRETKIRKGRTYEDFLSYTTENADLPIVEMDLVEGKKGGKVLLTMLFRSSKLMLAFILEDKTAASVINVFNKLEKQLGIKLFKKTFPIILTDNGSEFAKVEELENNKDKICRTKIFYCDPQASYQKGALEKNHEFIRYVIPKGKSMDDYTGEDITKMINHINSLTRKSLNNRSPFEVAKLLIHKRVLKELNLIKVPAKEIKLTPKLLKKN